MYTTNTELILSMCNIRAHLDTFMIEYDQKAYGTFKKNTKNWNIVALKNARLANPKANYNITTTRQ